MKNKLRLIMRLMVICTALSSFSEVALSQDLAFRQDPAGEFLAKTDNRPEQKERTATKSVRVEKDQNQVLEQTITGTVVEAYFKIKLIFITKTITQ